MRATIKKKLCWNCEGNVSREADNCPYCGVYLHPLGDHDRYQDDDEEEIVSKEPPYRPESTPIDTKTIPTPPYQLHEPVEKTEQIDLSVEPFPQINNGEEIKIIALPLLLLLFGANFFLFGLVLFLFASHGVLTLHWDATYWFVYLAASIPLLFFGWKTLK